MRVPSLILLALMAGCAGPDPEVSLFEAQASFDRGDYSTSVIHLQNVLQADPESVGARVLLGRIALQAGDFGQARGYLESARDLGAPPEDYLFPLASVEVMANRGREALSILDSIPAASRGAEFWFLRADAHTRLAEYELAGQALDRAVENDGSAALVALGRARLAAIGGDLRAAEALVTEAVETDSSLAEVYALRASLSASAGRLERAAEDLSVAAEIFQADARPLLAAQILLRLIQVQLALNDIDAASESAGRLDQLVPSAAFTTYARALIAYQRGDFEETVQLMRRVVNEVPEQPQFLALLGAANMAVGNYGQAEQQFLSILSRTPDDPAAIRLLAEVRIRQQRPGAALAALQRVEVGQQSTDVGLLTLQGAAYLQNGEPELALPFLEQALSIDPTNQPVTMQLIQAYAAAGRSDEADQLIRSSPGIDDSLVYARNLSMVLAELQAGNIEAADAAVAEVLRSGMDSPGAHLLAAVYYQLTNDPAAAREEVDTALGLDASFIPARLLLAELLVEQELYELAEEQLLRATEIEPASVPAWMALARLAIERGRTADGEAYLLSAVERSDSIVPRTALARLYLSTGNLPEARVQADAAAEIAGNLPDVRVALAMVALAEGEPSEAAELLSAVQVELPNRPAVAILLAEAQIAAGEAAAARETLAAAASRMPGVPNLSAALGRAHLLAGDAAEALGVARDLQVGYPQQSTGFALEAELRVTERLYDEASRLYGLAYDRDRRWDLLVNLVAASRLSSQPGREEALVREWLEGVPGDVRARLFLAELLESSEELQAAYAEYQRVIEIDADNVMALNNAAWLALELGRDEGLEYALRASELAADNAAVLDTAGWMLTEQDRAAEGLQYLRRATELSPQALEIRYHLGVAQAELGQVDAARATLQAVVNELGESTMRESAQALLETL